VSYLFSPFVFAVERGASANAAVRLVSNGDSFYIPRPQLGTVDEERPLPVLDLVSQAIVMGDVEGQPAEDQRCEPCFGALSVNVPRLDRTNASVRASGQTT